MRIISKSCILSDVQEWAIKKGSDIYQAGGLSYANYQGRPMYIGVGLEKIEGSTAKKTVLLRSSQPYGGQKNYRTLGLVYNSSEVASGLTGANPDYPPIFVNNYFYFITKISNFNETQTYYIIRTSDFSTYEQVYTQVYTSGSSIRGLAYGNGVFVALIQEHNHNHTIVSDDGENWTMGAENIDYTNGVKFINGNFFIYSGSRFAISGDGVNLTEKTVPYLYINGLYDYVNGKYIALTLKGQVTTSTDLTSWTPLKDITDIEFSPTAIVSNGEEVCVVGFNQYLGIIATTKDGENWKYTKVDGYRWTGVTYGDRCFCAIGYGADNDYKLISARKRV